jgi:hypothetical protein
MSNDLLVSISLIAYTVASYFDARSSVEMSRYGVRELIPLYWGKHRLFFLPSYIVLNILAVAVTMVYSYPAYQRQTIAVFFSMAAFKFIVAFVWNPARLKKAKEQSNRIHRKIGAML